VTMAASFMLLSEFARRGGLKFGVPLPGPWIYVASALLLVAVGFRYGMSSADALARYVFAAGGGLGASAVIFARRKTMDADVQGIVAAIAAGFAAYAIAAGVIVAPAPFWPANVINRVWFANATGIPIELVRSLIVLLLVLLISAGWGRILISAVDSSSYAAYLRRQFVGILVAMAAIILVGLGLTNLLGEVYRANVETEAAGEVDLLISRTTGEVATPDAMVQMLAGSPLTPSWFVGGDPAARHNAQATLDLAVRAAGAARGSIVDASGAVLASSPRREFALLGAPNRRAENWFDASIDGRAGHYFRFDPVTGVRSYVASYPIAAAGGSIMGVAVLETSLEKLESDLRKFDQTFFVVDPHGEVMLTNRPDQAGRSLWPRTDGMSLNLMEQFGAPRIPTMLAGEVSGGEWTGFAGRRAYLLRKPIGDTQWSMVLAIPVTGIFASRLLGIIVTLQVAIAALFYCFGRERGVRDRILRQRSEQLQDHARDLAHQAATDALTGLYNRLRFNERLEEELARSRRTGAPFSLIIYDIDHFKEINDLYGHPVGDRVLVGLSRTVAANVRQTDLLARWGGEEFVILLPDTDAPAAAETAEKLRLLIAHTIFDQIGTITSSFGVAQHNAADSAESLLSRVDNALYRAKLNGRNRVELDAPVVDNVDLSPAD
jgi:diguanylate cyclase (GGDEF)-like protein